MKVKILANELKDWTESVKNEVKAFLKSNGFLVVDDSENSSIHVEVTICVGGDGTIFYYNHLNKLEGKVLAIGSDSSHLCVLHKDKWKENILHYLSGMHSEVRITLEAKVGGKIYSAINDVVLHTKDYRTIKAEIVVDNSHSSFEGDGIIISTPTGSTAYAYSAGGIIIDESVGAIEIVPICPYKKLYSPEIVHDDSKILISSDRISDLIIDGIFIKNLSSDELVEVYKGKNILFLV